MSAALHRGINTTARTEITPNFLPNALYSPFLSFKQWPFQREQCTTRQQLMHSSVHSHQAKKCHMNVFLCSMYIYTKQSHRGRLSVPGGWLSHHQTSVDPDLLSYKRMLCCDTWLCFSSITYLLSHMLTGSCILPFTMCLCYISTLPKMWQKCWKPASALGPSSVWVWVCVLLSQQRFNFSIYLLVILPQDCILCIH